MYIYFTTTQTMGETNENKVTKVAASFIIVALILLAIYLANDILFPLFMALLLAILLRPVVRLLHEKLRIPHIIAVAFTLLIAVGVVFGILFFLSIQISEFMSDLPMIQKNLEHHLWQTQNWIQNTFGVSFSEQENYLEDQVANTEMLTTSSVSSLTNSLFDLVLIPIYTFLILLYRSLFLGFLLKMAPEGSIKRIENIVSEIKVVIRSYITGLLIELLIVAILTATGLWIIGVKYFIFLGLMTALLNLIPYIGILVAATISALIALIGSPDVSIVIGVIIVNAIVQFIDNNILIPKIVGSKVSINALASMVAVIIGGSLAGIAGMFLAIPVVAIIKVIFDRSPSMEAFGYLLGDEIPKTFNWKVIGFSGFGQSRSKEEPVDAQEESTEEDKTED